MGNMCQELGDNKQKSARDKNLMPLSGKWRRRKEEERRGARGRRSSHGERNEVEKMKEMEEKK